MSTRRRRRRRPRPRRRPLPISRQALAAYCEGRPGETLAALVAAGDGVRAARLLEAEGAELLAGALPAVADQQAGLFRVGLLGIPRVTFVPPEGGEAETRSWTLRRAFKVFAYLAVAPDHRAGRDEVVEAGWPEEGEGMVQRNFHPTLSHLRRALLGGKVREADRPPPLLFGDGVYRLNPVYRWWVDAVELSSLVARGQRLLDRGDERGAAERWQAAWRLYRGPFLEGYYDSWVIERREALVRSYLDCLRRLGDLERRRGRLLEALDAYRSVLVVDPLEERIHLAVMQIYGEQGRRDLVRRQYDRLAELLRDELGVEPLPETATEYHRLMR